MTSKVSHLLIHEVIDEWIHKNGQDPNLREFVEVLDKRYPDGWHYMYPSTEDFELNRKPSLVMTRNDVLNLPTWPNG